MSLIASSRVIWTSSFCWSGKIMAQVTDYEAYYSSNCLIILTKEQFKALTPLQNGSWMPGIFQGFNFRPARSWKKQYYKIELSTPATQLTMRLSVSHVLIEWLTVCATNILTDWLSDLLIGPFPDILTGQPTVQAINWMIEWLTGWLIHGTTELSDLTSKWISSF